MLRRSLRILPIALACSAPLIGAHTAAAACVSTPTSASQADPVGDDSGGLAPDATALAVSIDGTCTATFSYTLPKQSALLSGDFLAWFINADGNLSTGSASFSGADYSLGRLGSGGAAISRWDTATAKFVVGEAIPTAGPFGVQLDLNKITGFGTKVMTVTGGTLWTSTSGSSYADFVNTPLPFTITTSEPVVATPVITPAPTAAPAPAPVPTNTLAPVAPAATPSPSFNDDQEDECEVPVVRRMKLGDARAEIRVAGCKVGRITKRTSKVIKAGRVIQGDKYPGETVPIGTKINLVISTGKPAKRLALRSGVSEVVDAVNEIADAAR